MSGLVDPQGRPLVSTFAAAQTGRVRNSDGGFVSPPMVNSAVGQWAGRDQVHFTLPGGGVMQFDLTRLSLADFRAMRQHYQLGASLNVLGFIMHQIDWEIECEDAEMKEVLEGDLRKNWTLLIRSISQAFWAGFSPIAVNYENAGGYVRIKNFKDLIPEECRVEWEEEEGWAPEGKVKPKLYHYNGLKQNGFWIPPENTLWYPLLMENGDYYGRKLLRPAFPSWYFSNLMHLFANRYFERFGEPVPVGRAPLDEMVDPGGGQPKITAKTAMEQVIGNLRNRAVVVLPSDRDPMTKEFDYQIEYMESQMRGADFERYLSRLDEEMSLSVFTPVLLFRTADVGSYNLGEAHLRIFQQMLNSIAGDLQVHFQKYLVDRMRVVNFGQNSPPATWVFRKQGQGDIETYKLLMSEVVRLGAAMPNLEELGKIVGLTFDKVEMLTKDNPDGDDKVVSGDTTQSGTPKPSNNSKLSPAVGAVIKEAATRLERELSNGKTPTLGFKNKITNLLYAEQALRGEMFQGSYVDRAFESLNNWVAQTATFLTPEEMGEAAERLLTEEIERFV